MAKTKISEYSSTSAGANLNTDINTIDIDEGCAPSGINNAIRTLMAQLKDFQTGVSGDGLTLGGALSGTSATFSGNVTASAISGASLTLSGNVTASAISGASMTLSGDLTVDTDTLHVDSTNNRVGVGTTSPSSELEVESTAGTAIQITAGTSNASQLKFADADSATVGLINYSHVANSMAFHTNGSQQVTIDSSGNVGIGTSSPARPLEVKQSGDSFISITAGNANSSVLELGDSDDINIGRILYNHSSNYLATYTDNTERMRVDSNGNFAVACTSNPVTATSGSGGLFHAAGLYLTLAANNGACLNLNRISTDGTLIVFRQNGAVEGSISVAGTTVSYNGGHLSRFTQLPNSTKDESILKGTVLSNLDDMCVYVNAETGETADNEQLNKVKVSDVEGDPNVAGVHVSWIYDEQNDVEEINMGMTGDMIIRIAQGVTVNRGDLLMSAGDGTAKPQGDDIVRSKTIAKVTSTNVTCTYDDGSYCVPCVLMAC